MKRRIVRCEGQLRWNAIDTETGKLLGYAVKYPDGYFVKVGQDEIRLRDSGDALLWLSLKTDTKEGRDAYFARAEAKEQVAPTEVRREDKIVRPGPWHRTEEASTAQPNQGSV